MQIFEGRVDSLGEHVGTNEQKPKKKRIMHNETTENMQCKFSRVAEEWGASSLSPSEPPHIDSGSLTAKFQICTSTEKKKPNDISCLHVSICAGAQPVARPGSRLPHHRQTLHKCPASLLSLSGNELSVLQPLHLRLAAQQGALSPQGLSLSQLPWRDCGESIVQELTAEGNKPRCPTNNLPPTVHQRPPPIFLKPCCIFPSLQEIHACVRFTESYRLAKSFKC